MSDSNRSSNNNNNNQDLQSVEFIDKSEDSHIHAFTSPEVLNKNHYSDDNEGHNTIEDFSQSNNQDSRNESEKKVEFQSAQQDNSSSEPQQIFREQSDDSQNQNENSQHEDLKNEIQFGDEEYQQEEKEVQSKQDQNEQSVQDEAAHLQNAEYNNQNKYLEKSQEQFNQEEDQEQDETRQKSEPNLEDNQEESDRQQLIKVQQVTELKESQINENQSNQIQQEQGQNLQSEQNNDQETEQTNLIQQSIDQQFEEEEEEEEDEQELRNLEQSNLINKQASNDEDENKVENDQQNEEQVEQLQEQQSQQLEENIQYEQQQEEQVYQQQEQQQQQKEEVEEDWSKQLDSNKSSNQNNNLRMSQNEANEINQGNRNANEQQNQVMDEQSLSAQQQYEYMIEMQKKQAEFQRQMEELNQKYKINFRKIIDTRQESLEGNYMAGLLAIKMKYKSIETKDQTGMTILHNAVLGNEKELVLFLLNNGADVNAQDVCQRTPLMMAAHGGSSQANKFEQNTNKNFDEDSEEYRKMMKLHSFNKIFKILIDKGACFASKDAYQFSALLYSVQNQNLLILFYLVYLGANLRDSDMNGSSVVHWNAYKGNRFLTEVFNSLNLDMFTADNQSYTPLQRSILGISYSTIDYLARLLPPDQVPDPDLKEDDGITYKIPSPSIRHNLFSIKYGHKNIQNRILAWWNEKCNKAEESGIHPATFVFFIISGALFYSAFTQIYSNRSYTTSHKQNETWLSSIQFFINITFFIATFIYMSFSVRFSNTMIGYKNRSKGQYILDDEAIDRTAQLKLEEQRNIPPYMKGIMSDRLQFERILQRMNFKHIDRLLDDAPQFKATQNKEEELNRTTITDNGDEESRMGLTSSSSSSQSYSHLTFIHQIAILFENNYFTSLGEIDFSRLCGACLKYKPEKTKHCYICKTCVPYYQFHSTLFNMCISAENHFLYLIHLFSLQISLFTYLLISHIQFTPFLESWAMFKYFEIPYHMSYKIGIFHSTLYLIVLFAFFYNSVYCIIELIGMFEDKTRDEILNPFDYAYNFEVITEKNKNLVKVPKIRTTGIMEYLKDTLKSFYYRTFLHLKQKK